MGRSGTRLGLGGLGRVCLVRLLAGGLELLVPFRRCLVVCGLGIFGIREHGRGKFIRKLKILTLG